MVSALVMQLLSIQNYMGWFMTIYIIFGVIGNLLNCLIFLRKQLRSSSCSCYLLAGSIANIIVLMFIGWTSIYAIGHPDPSNSSLAFCKIRGYIGHVSIMLSRSFIVLACFDLACISSSKVSMRNIGKIRIALIITLLCTLIWIVMSIHVLIWSTIINGKCLKPTLYNTIFSIYVFVIVGVAPPLLMIIFSLITLRNIRLAHRRIRPQLTFTGMRQRDYQLTRMLVAEVLVYILSTLPFPFNSLYSTVTISIAKSVDRQIIEAFINFITGTFLIFINPSSTFYIYLATSKTFRSEVKATFNNIAHQIFRIPQQPRLPTISNRTTIM